VIDITDAATAATPRIIFVLFDYGVFYCPQFINEQNIPSADVRAYRCVVEGHRCFFNCLAMGTHFHPFVLASLFWSQVSMLLAFIDDPTRVESDVDWEDRQNLRDVGLFNGFINFAVLSLLFPLEFNRFRFIVFKEEEDFTACHVFRPPADVVVDFRDIFILHRRSHFISLEIQSDEGFIEKLSLMAGREVQTGSVRVYMHPFRGGTFFAQQPSLVSWLQGKIKT